MIYLCGLVGFLLVLSAEANGNSTIACSETRECLGFDPICQAETYEARKIGSVKWVTTEETSYFMEMAMMRAFKRLYQYITGANSNGENLEMTSPVIVKMPVKSFWKMGVYQMSFLLPADHQANPPKPTNDKVSINTWPETKVYVRGFGGWMNSLAIQKNLESLMADLDADDAEYEKGFHYVAGYNSPMTLFNRHNEVWVVAKDDPECSISKEMESLPFA